MSGKKRSELSKSMAHDMKTPLSVIRNYSEIINDRIDDENRYPYANYIMEKVDKMDRSIVEILNLYKLESKNYHINKTAWPMNTLIACVCEKFHVLISQKEQHLTLRLAEQDSVWADQKSIETVLSNLLSNAVTYTPNNKNIEISTVQEKNKLTVRVQNDGSPIPQALLPKIWEPFFKADESRERKISGSGLGLAIVKNLMVLHGAEYGVENTAQGVCFWFSICRNEKK